MADPNTTNPEFARVMQIFVRFDKTYTLDVRPDDTVDVLRRLIMYKIGAHTPPDAQFLKFRGKLLGVSKSDPLGSAVEIDDTQTLESYGIGKESKISDMLQYF